MRLIDLVEIGDGQCGLAVLMFDAHGVILAQAFGYLPIGSIELLRETFQGFIRVCRMTEGTADLNSVGLPFHALQKFGAGIAPTVTGGDIDIAAAQRILQLIHHTKRVASPIDLSVLIEN